jgi:hypothetical protein
MVHGPCPCPRRALSGEHRKHRGTLPLGAPYPWEHLTLGSTLPLGTWPLRCASRRSMRPHRAQPRTSTPPPPLLSCAAHTCEPCLGQGEHAKAEACWGEARRTLLAMHAAAQGGKGGKGEPGGSSEARAARAAAEVQAAGERLELQLCMADCMRCQGRFDESEASSRSRRRRSRSRRSRRRSRRSRSRSSSRSSRRRRFDDSEASMAKGTLPLPLTSTPTLIPKPKPNPNPAPTPTLPLTRRVCSRGGRGASST